MHKSGTSLVAELLHRSGIPMGEGAEVSGSYDAGTFFERSAFRALNQELLGPDDPDELNPRPLRLQLSARQRARMRELVAHGEDGGADWGFKDPRTCLTYEVWRPELPPH